MFARHFEELGQPCESRQMDSDRECGQETIWLSFGLGKVASGDDAGLVNFESKLVSRAVGATADENRPVALAGKKVDQSGDCGSLAGARGTEPQRERVCECVPDCTALGSVARQDARHSPVVAVWKANTPQRLRHRTPVGNAKKASE